MSNNRPARNSFCQFFAGGDMAQSDDDSKLGMSALLRRQIFRGALFSPGRRFHVRTSLAGDYAGNVALANRIGVLRIGADGHKIAVAELGGPLPPNRRRSRNRSKPENRAVNMRSTEHS